MNIKKILILIIITISLMSSNILATIPPAPLEEKSQEELLYGAIMAFLEPAIREGLDNCYKNILKSPPNYADYLTRILKVDRFNDGHTAYYTIEIEVEPYIAAHIGVGRDRILIKIGYSDAPTLLNSIHLIDYRLPERYNSYYLNDQPNPVD